MVRTLHLGACGVNYGISFKVVIYQMDNCQYAAGDAGGAATLRWGHAVPLQSDAKGMGERWIRLARRGARSPGRMMPLIRSSRRVRRLATALLPTPEYSGFPRG